MNNPVLIVTAWFSRILPDWFKQFVYKLGPVTVILRKILNIFVPKGERVVTIAAGELAGMRMCLNMKSEKDYWLGTYETKLQSTIHQMVQPGMVAYDVGANIGYITLILAKIVGTTGHVFAFEALEGNLDRLHENLKLNDLQSRVEVVSNAIVDTKRKVRFLKGPSLGTGKANGSAGRQNFSYSNASIVNGISLDDFVYDSGNPPPHIVKIDVEGGEVFVLPGMQRLLVEQRPLVLIELHGKEAANVVWNLLIKAGYHICFMETDYPEVASPEMLEWKSYIVGLPMELD